jgi:hypothetical protein
MKGVPRAIDIFEEDNNTYLVTELVKGKPLSLELNNLGAGMLDTRVDVSVKLGWLDWLLQIISLVKEMHVRGYVHRDITPENFLVTEKGIYMIDPELSCSLKDNLPDPPFLMGTRGYMSPAQQQLSAPSIQDDIYAIGGLIFVFFTNISPVNIKDGGRDVVRGEIIYLVGNREIGALITACRDDDPHSRPDIKVIEGVLLRYQKALRTGWKETEFGVELDNSQLSLFLNNCLAGLSGNGLCSPEGIWWTRPVMEVLVKGIAVNYVRMLSPSFEDGVSGILYLLAALKKKGLLTAELEKYYYYNLDFVRERYLQQPGYLKSGLYEGGAGVAWALIEGIKSGVIRESDLFTEFVYRLLEMPIDGLDIGNGAAGKGMVLLRSGNLLDKERRNILIQKCMDYILVHQELSGNILFYTGFSKGVAGLAYFLWCYLQEFEDNAVQELAKKIMMILDGRIVEQSGEIGWFSTSEKKNVSCWFEDGAAGILLCYIKAWQVSGNLAYRTIIERALNSLPDYTRTSIFGYKYGCTGLGDVYLQAWKVFGRESYLRKAQDIVRLLTGTAGDLGGWYGWRDRSGVELNGGLLNGTGGCIYFIFRYQYGVEIASLWDL